MACSEWLIANGYTLYAIRHMLKEVIHRSTFFLSGLKIILNSI